MDRVKPAKYLVFLGLLAAAPQAANAWDEEGHVIVTRLAWEKLPEDMPSWLKTPEVRYRLEYLSAEPDRWRGQHSVDLDHVNSPNHFIDLEDLEPYGLTAKTLPPLRREFLDYMATSRVRHAEKFTDVVRVGDRDDTRLVPGLLSYEIAELQWKIASSWTTLKTYEQYRSMVTDEMIENARANIVFHMGIISHFVGDGSQPLHTTRHFTGWVGENPNGYTVDKKIHSFIDGGVIALHKLTSENMAPLAAAPRAVSTETYWKDINAYLLDTFSHMEPLYQLEKSGELKREKGKQFIQERLKDGGAMLAGVWIAAYKGATIDDFRVRRLKEKHEAAAMSK